jgi:hypothetical protein
MDQRDSRILLVLLLTLALVLEKPRNYPSPVDAPALKRPRDLD